MAATENLSKINLKTYITLFVIVFLSAILFIAYSAFIYQESDYHSSYRILFVAYNTVILIINNMLIITLLAMIFCYSLVIRRTDLITSDGSRIIFAQVISRGLYIVIVFTILFFLMGEFLSPWLQKELSGMRDRSSIGRVLRQEGDTAYKRISDNRSKSWKSNQRRAALGYYQDYIEVIPKDNEINLRIRELSTALNIEQYDASREKKKVSNTEDTSIAKTIVFHSDLAEIYFRKKDYITAWYYYKHIVESDSSLRAHARQRIRDIKQILAYRDTMKDSRQHEAWLVDTEREIRDIYRKKKLAKKYLDAGEYQKAFFVYQDILTINPNLRDVIQAKNETYSTLTREAIELSQIESMRIFPAQKDFVFMNGPNTLIHIGRIVKQFSSFYMYDVKIITYDKRHRPISEIKAKYGHVKTSTSFSLYCYSLNDRNVEYFPKKNGSITKEYMYDLPVDINILYNFSYGYRQVQGYSIGRLFQIGTTMGWFPRLIRDKKKKVKAKEQAWSIGFNDNFVKTAILDKLSRFFLFFSLNLLLIGIAWKFRANYVGAISFLHIPLLALIPLFVTFVVRLCEGFITSFYSVLSLAGNFMVVMVICVVINILFMIGSIIFIASNRV